MRLFKWIAANKIVIILPLLALIAVSIFVFTQNRVQARNSNPAATESNPTSSVKTAVEPAAEKRVAAATATQTPAKAEITSTTSKVVFQVDNMSCSGCIATIKSSLAGYAGIQDIIVDIAGGVTEVYYDSREIKDINPLASSITASGYPARVSRILTADQISKEEAIAACKEEAIAASRAKFYIASVSGWDISRSDFNKELAFAKNRYEQAYGQNVFASDQGKTLLDGLKAQVVSRLINEGIQMQEVQRAGYRLDPKIVDSEFAQFMKQKELDLEKLKASLEKNGYPFDYFMKRFENQVLLNRYLDEKVLGGAASDYDKQDQYRAWFNNARVLSKVTIYDSELKQLTRSQSSGSGCGQSSGSSCCSTNKS
jgi:copper chaperone CopZ